MKTNAAGHEQSMMNARRRDLRGGAGFFLACASALVFTAFGSSGCGGAVADSSGPTTAYALTNATLSNQDLLGDAFVEIIPSLQGLCPSLDPTALAPVVATDADGSGVVLLTTPCFAIHVPVVVGQFAMNADGSGAFLAAVPTDDFIAALKADLVTQSIATCASVTVPESDIRSAANGYEANGGASEAVISLQLSFAARAVSSPPAAAANPCD